MEVNMQDFRQLKVWEKSHDLTLAVYRATAEFPTEEKYGLTGQIRRSCSSIPTNIAEGCGRGSDPEFGRFLQIAMGSASELEYQLLLARDLSLLPVARYEGLHGSVTEVKRMLATFILKLRADS
jgi:four helix bundle protein